jgi:2-polyprenyl-6-methoxyphenol hydroxylase-like FAD-dependent oxidoreductase
VVVQPGRAEIVGAGFGGLVAAIALSQRGWDVRVHERRDALAAEGQGIAIQRNMARIFEQFGILDEILAGGARIDRRDSMDGAGNVVLSRKTERSPWRIDRGHVIALLAERAARAGADIRLASPVAGATPDGTITLAGGETSRADLVVVADGVGSAIRDSHHLVKRRIWQKDGGVRVAIPRLAGEIAAAKRDGSVMIEAWADRRRILYCPVNAAELYVLLTCMADDEAARATPIDPAVWAMSFPWLGDLFERIRDHADWPRSHWARFQTVRLKQWSAGRLAVLGDAAHAMPPYLAQGAGHAMMNALGLAASLETSPDLASALALWERRERPLTEHTQRWTRIYGTTIFLPKPLKQTWIMVERNIPWIGAQYLRAANHHPTGCQPGG